MTIQTAVLIETLVELAQMSDGVPVIFSQLKIMLLQLQQQEFQYLLGRVNHLKIIGSVLGMH